MGAAGCRAQAWAAGLGLCRGSVLDLGPGQDADRALFHIGYTVEGMGKLLRRHGWSVQVPARRAIERDEQAIVLWKAEVWPAAKPPRRTWVPTCASKPRPGRD
ncbi:winged helix-turn-helix domain-containing protein [Nonomuraea sp. GTA35]|uniref:helix-turn-helix domain-containing protein n=1 Tax=Nonomuraea sp. GTA35 TaxID=1676746 RepID=UPI0035C065F8